MNLLETLLLFVEIPEQWVGAGLAAATWFRTPSEAALLAEAAFLAFQAEPLTHRLLLGRADRLAARKGGFALGSQSRAPLLDRRASPRLPAAG